MNWFIFSLICIAGWGFADLFYKLSSDENDKYSHLKITVWVGLIMGTVALILMPFSETGITASSLFTNILKYTPASTGYIVSMIIGYVGLRYLELSVVSPVQNASGAFSTVAMIIFFAASGNATKINGQFSALNITGTAVIVIGVILLAFAERKANVGAENTAADKKYKTGALALIFPLLYCLFDTLGTAADGIILSEESGLNIGEIDVLILYGLTFFAVGIICYVYLCIKTKQFYNPFALKTEWQKACAAIAEQFGQIFYVFAMAEKPMLSAPMVASYCIFSVILSRLCLKEKLTKMQYISVFSVIAGIVMLGISEGLEA